MLKPDPSRPIRSIAKGISYRLVAIPMTLIFAYLVTGNLVIAGSFGILEILKIFVFFLHERVWHQIPFGKIQ